LTVIFFAKVLERRGESNDERADHGESISRQREKGKAEGEDIGTNGRKCYI
jgi:hypothetical protein